MDDDRTLPPDPDQEPTMSMGPAGGSPASDEDVGTVIGPYRLVRRLGQGGMGEVFEAEQTEPIRRRVALKVIKQGMDTRTVIARFDAERQALALMDHPCIAKVYDAGATARGRPLSSSWSTSTASPSPSTATGTGWGRRPGWSSS